MNFVELSLSYFEETTLVGKHIKQSLRYDFYLGKANPYSFFSLRSGVFGLKWSLKLVQNYVRSAQLNKIILKLYPTAY